MHIYVYTYLSLSIYIHIYIYIYIYIVGGGSETSANPSDLFVHKPGPGIPTSSTPYQQPALTMPQIGEGATSGPEALFGGGRTSLTKFSHSLIQSFRLVVQYYPIRAHTLQYPSGTARSPSSPQREQ